MPARVRVWVRLPVAPDFTIVMIGLSSGVVRLQRLTDLFGGLLPDLHQLAVALVVVELAALVLLLDRVGLAS